MLRGRALLWSGCLLSVTVIALVGCVKSQMYRPQNIEPHENYTMAFIEFDDHGEPWAPSQLERTISLIERANRDGKRSLVMLFVHGWHNDASTPEHRKKENNVEGFQRLLDVTVSQLQQEGIWRETDSLIGVYLGWRGRSTNAKLLKPLTFYSRRGAGQRVAGVGTTEAIMRVMAAAQTNPESAGVVIGHSFGGMIVERALMQTLIGYTVERDEEITPFADLVVLLNPASQSMRAKEMISILQRNRLKFLRENPDGTRIEAPFIVSITSTGDTATGDLYPTALGLKAITKGFRKYSATDCMPASSQKSFYNKTAGHNPILHSHVVTSEPLPEAETGVGKPMTLETSTSPLTGDKQYSFLGERNRFTIERLSLNYNDTPYWIMSVPPELIRTHSDIFNFNTLQLLRAVARMSGALSGRVGMLVREDGVRPLGLAAMPEGGIAFVETTRRFYALPRGSSRPLALSCVPPFIDPQTVIGAAIEGSYVGLVTSGLEKAGDKPKNRTYVTLFDFGLDGSSSQELQEIHSDLRFTAAAGSIGNSRLYLATESALYVADLAKKKPKPELLFEFDDEAPRIEEMALDRDRDRIFTIAREAGALHLIDLSSENPRLEPVASGLGLLADLVIAPDESLYLLDASGKRILRMNCPQGSQCSQPERFAAPPEFQRPIAIDIDVDGNFWVADIDAQSLFTLDREGKVIRVLDSMRGHAP